MGSQIVSPKTCALALVMKTPIAAKRVIVVGRATTWPTSWSRCERPKRVKSGMLSDSVAQKPTIAVTLGTKTPRKEPKVSNFPGAASRSPSPCPSALDRLTAHTTSASVIVFGQAIWDPIDLGAKLGSRPLVAVAELTAVVATLAMNIAANVVSPANDFSNLAPSRISFRTGGLVTGLLATLMMPWKLLENSDRYINGWLLGYSGGLGSIAGVLICDYWVIRRKRLVLADLYRRDGVYSYDSPLGTNWAAIAATVAGCFVAWIGLFVPALHWLYDAAWFSGTLTSATVYGAWMWSRRAP